MSEYSPKQTEHTATPERADTKQYRPILEFITALSEAHREEEADELYQFMRLLEASHIMVAEHDTLDKLSKVPTDDLIDDSIAPLLNYLKKQVAVSYRAQAQQELEDAQRTIARYGGALCIQQGPEMKVIDDVEIVSDGPNRLSLVAITDDEQHITVHKHRLVIDSGQLSEDYAALLHRHQQEHEI